MYNNNNNTKSFWFFDALCLLFIALKLTGYIYWSWFWVLSPVLIPLIIVLVIAVALAVKDKLDYDKLRR